MLRLSYTLGAMFLKYVGMCEGPWILCKFLFKCFRSFLCVLTGVYFGLWPLDPLLPWIYFFPPKKLYLGAVHIPYNSPVLSVHFSDLSKFIELCSDHCSLGVLLFGYSQANLEFLSRLKTFPLPQKWIPPVFMLLIPDLACGPRYPLICLSVYIKLPFLDVSHKWNQTIYDILHLFSLIMMFLRFVWL